MRLRWLSVRHLGILLVAVTAGAAACGGQVDGSSHAPAGVDCQAFCTRMLAPHCPNDDLGQCVSDCTALPSQGCSTLHQNLLDCSVHKAKYLCSGDHAVMQGCDQQLQDYLGCVNVSGQDAGIKDAASGG